jgi:hypothetical protein
MEVKEYSSGRLARKLAGQQTFHRTLVNETGDSPTLWQRVGCFPKGPLDLGLLFKVVA